MTKRAVKFIKTCLCTRTELLRSAHQFRVKCAHTQSHFRLTCLMMSWHQNALLFAAAGFKCFLRWRYLRCFVSFFSRSLNSLQGMFSWERRPMSAGYTRRELLQHQYSVDDVLKTSGIKSPSVGCAEWKASNARQTNNIRKVECRVDTGQHRNPAVAYWLKPNRGHPGGVSNASQHRPHSASTASTSQRLAQQHASHDASLPQSSSEEPLHIVYVSPQWRAAGVAKPFSSNPQLRGLVAVESPSAMQSPRVITVPWKTSTVKFADGTTTTKLTAHQHLHFSNPAPPVDDISLPLSDVAVDPHHSDDESFLVESPRGLTKTISPSSTSLLGGSANMSQGRRLKGRRHRAIIQTAADMLSEVAIVAAKREKKQQSLPRRQSQDLNAAKDNDDDTQLLAEFGVPRCRRWQTAIQDATSAS